MGCRGLKISKAEKPFYSNWDLAYPYQTRKFLWGGDDYDAATIGSCWFLVSINEHGGRIKKYFIEEHKRWGRGLVQTDA